MRPFPLMDAHSGTTLEIVNTTVAYGARTVSAVTEVCVRRYCSVRVLIVQYMRPSCRSGT